MFGHIARIDQPLPDYDLWSAVQKELREYGPQVDEEPTVPPIPDDAVS
ncbi:hypothetical protein N836_35865 [Leptolyngbya sp. Heron Island J]|nr:hypothetical protein [Leptolyngbya sp. Heron Island J]ESA37752.1 hypothetical protein N836_35865 [Leptolyngbya sp. Heron Island J]